MDEQPMLVRFASEALKFSLACVALVCEFLRLPK